jgi:prepilin-type N-terminal cleavage/methylation domain-containing protein
MNHSPTTRQPAGFTVVELLTVMLILSLLVAMSLSAFSAAVNQAKISRTKVIIAKLDQLVMDRWESYRTRPIPLRGTGTSARLSSERRLWALREIMRMELPNTPADVTDNPVLVSRTAISRGYLRKVPSGWSTDPTWQQAECLYLIIASMRDHEKSALDFFTADEIGDLDGDGVPEILDAWGTPIQFIRWPAGYLSSGVTNPALTTQDKTIPDSFDLLKVDRRYGDTNTNNDPYDLRPLIFSCGPDKQTSPTLGIILPTFGYSSTTTSGSKTVYPNPSDGTIPWGNDPYFIPSAVPVPGSIDGVSPVTSAQAATAAADNITNHYQEAE